MRKCLILLTTIAASIVCTAQRNYQKDIDRELFTIKLFESIQSNPNLDRSAFLEAYFCIKENYKNINPDELFEYLKEGEKKYNEQFGYLENTKEAYETALNFISMLSWQGKPLFELENTIYKSNFSNNVDNSLKGSKNTFEESYFLEQLERHNFDLCSQVYRFYKLIPENERVQFRNLFLEHNQIDVQSKNLPQSKVVAKIDDYIKTPNSKKNYDSLKTLMEITLSQLKLEKDLIKENKSKVEILKDLELDATTAKSTVFIISNLLNLTGNKDLQNFGNGFYHLSNTLIDINLTIGKFNNLKEVNLGSFINLAASITNSVLPLINFFQSKPQIEEIILDELRHISTGITEIKSLIRQSNYYLSAQLFSVYESLSTLIGGLEHRVHINNELSKDILNNISLLKEDIDQFIEQNTKSYIRNVYKKLRELNIATLRNSKTTINFQDNLSKYYSITQESIDPHFNDNVSILPKSIINSNYDLNYLSKSIADFIQVSNLSFANDSIINPKVWNYFVKNYLAYCWMWKDKYDAASYNYLLDNLQNLGEYYFIYQNEVLSKDSTAESNLSVINKLDSIYSVSCKIVLNDLKRLENTFKSQLHGVPINDLNYVNDLNIWDGPSQPTHYCYPYRNQTLTSNGRIAFRYREMKSDGNPELPDMIRFDTDAEVSELPELRKYAIEHPEDYIHGIGEALLPNCVKNAYLFGEGNFYGRYHALFIRTGTINCDRRSDELGKMIYDFNGYFTNNSTGKTNQYIHVNLTNNEETDVRINWHTFLMESMNGIETLRQYASLQRDQYFRYCSPYDKHLISYSLSTNIIDTSTIYNYLDHFVYEKRKEYLQFVINATKNDPTFKQHLENLNLRKAFYLGTLNIILPESKANDEIFKMAKEKLFDSEILLNSIIHLNNSIDSNNKISSTAFDSILNYPKYNIDSITRSRLSYLRVKGITERNFYVINGLQMIEIFKSGILSKKFKYVKN
jgi:hypothetical protein